MQFHTDDQRDYSEIIENWVRNFRSTLDDDPQEGDMPSGYDYGQKPFGVKIIFDGYGENDDGSKDLTCESYVVFVHKNSLTEEFPPHEQTPWALIHRPKEEVCIWTWYDVVKDRVEVIPFEENNSTELDHNFVVNLIQQIHRNYW